MLDTNTHVDHYKREESIPASANIIYEELVDGRNMEKYDIMLKQTPYVIYEDEATHVQVKKVILSVPDCLPYNFLCGNRTCYVKQYHGVDDNGVCFIICKKMNSHVDKHTNEVQIKEYDESIIIEPISGCESKVIMVSNFDYGGRLPGIVKHKIAIERLKYLLCVKSYFYDMNQSRIYETFKKATEIVNEIQRTSMKEVGQGMSTFQRAQLEDKEEVKLQHSDNSEVASQNESADAGAEIDEASDINSLNDSYRDLTTSFMKNNPFVADKVKRNTVSAHPSYKNEKLDSGDKEEVKRHTKHGENIDVIYEEVDDEI